MIFGLYFTQSFQNQAFRYIIINKHFYFSGITLATTALRMLLSYFIIRTLPKTLHSITFCKCFFLLFISCIRNWIKFRPTYHINLLQSWSWRPRCRSLQSCNAACILRLTKTLLSTVAYIYEAISCASKYTMGFQKYNSSSNSVFNGKLLKLNNFDTHALDLH